MNVLWLRKWHRKLSFLISLPLLLTILTGILLISRGKLPFMGLKIETKQTALTWSRMASLKDLELALPQILPDLKKSDIGKITLSPKKGLISLRTKNYEEILISADRDKLEVIGRGQRLSGLIVKLHEGSWFSSWVRDFIFLPMALVLLFLWFSGIILYLKTGKKKNKRIK